MPSPLQRPALRRLVSAPQFDSEEQTQRARMLHALIWTIMVVTTLIMPAIAVTQPGIARRALVVMLAIDSLGLALIALAHQQRVRLACIVLVAGLITIVTILATTAGGIRSPGVTMYFAFVLAAGVLLGERAAIAAALVCAALGGGLVIAELNGLVSPATRYGPIALLLLNMLYMSLVIVLTRLATGSVTGALERAESELAERREAERRLGLALDAAGIGIFEHEVGSDYFTGDDRGFEILGLSGQGDHRLPYEQWLAMTHPEDRDVPGQQLDGLTENTTPALNRYRIVTPSGEIRHVASVLTAMPAAADHPPKLVGMIMDVTEREKLVFDLAERVKELTVLQASASLLRGGSYFDHSVLPGVVNLIPAGWQYREHCEARLAYGDELYQTAGWRETPWRQEQTFRTSAGSGILEVAYTKEFPSADEGPFLAEERSLLNSLVELIVAFLENEHLEQQRRKVEHQLRQSQKMQALGVLAGGIAHDFNNILTAIGGNVDLVLVDVHEEQIRVPLIEVKGAHDRAKDLVRRILVFSRQQEPVRSVIPLEPVVDEALKLIRSSVGPHIRIITEFDADLPPVFADATQIHQVVMNLATNAAYAMTEHGGPLAVGIDTVDVRNPLVEELPPQLKPGKHVRLSVRDSGTGMSEEILNRLFEPFFTTKGAEGTGLGLSVVHGIVADHEGAIQVESTLGEGTLVRLYLPAATQRSTPVATTPTALTRGMGQRVICVDDEETVLVVLTRMLEKLGYNPHGFTNPYEALQEYRTRPHHYDACITDLGMPGMSGADLAVQIHEIRPELPVIILSGAPPVPNADSRTKWIQKPIGLRELSVVLQNVFSEKPLDIG